MLLVLPCLPLGHGGISNIIDDMQLLSTEAEGVNEAIPEDARRALVRQSCRRCCRCCCRCCCRHCLLNLPSPLLLRLRRCRRCCLAHQETHAPAAALPGRWSANNWPMQQQLLLQDCCCSQPLTVQSPCLFLQVNRAGRVGALLGLTDTRPGAADCEPAGAAEATGLVFAAVLAAGAVCCLVASAYRSIEL